MKKVIICMISLIYSATPFCQEKQPSQSSTRHEYLKKSKTQKIVGLVLLGAGAITLISVSGGNTDFGTLGTFVIAGAAATLASIPFFIASGRNKRKAMNTSLSFSSEINKNFPIGLTSRLYPAISLKL